MTGFHGPITVRSLKKAIRGAMQNRGVSLADWVKATNLLALPRPRQPLIITPFIIGGAAISSRHERYKWPQDQNPKTLSLKL
jgi:hypothetical protein